MARHSKWHKVKQFKGAIDAKRAASFTKLARLMTVAAREKGADPNTNSVLKAAVMKAREASMPKDAIERAIQRGAGGGTEGQIESLTYEAYAPGGIALIIECLTDNRHRTANEVKHLLSKAGGSLAASGSVTYVFDHVGVVRTERDLYDEQELALIDAGALNIIRQGGSVEIHTTLADLIRLSDVATGLGCHVISAEVEWIPKNTIDTSEEQAQQVLELIEQLEDHDDVKAVYSNMA